MDHSTIKLNITPIAFEKLTSAIIKQRQKGDLTDVKNKIYVSSCHIGRTSNALFALVEDKKFNVVYCDDIEPDEASVILFRYYNVRTTPPTDNTGQDIIFFSDSVDFEEQLKMYREKNIKNLINKYQLQNNQLAP